MSLVVLYFMQGEPCESALYPNAFVVPKAQEVLFGTFMQHFPLKHQKNLHFRFRVADEKFGHVWMDVNSNNTPLPIYQDTIMAKVLNLSDAATAKRKIHLKKKDPNSNPSFSTIKPTPSNNLSSRVPYRDSRSDFREPPSRISPINGPPRQERKPPAEGLSPRPPASTLPTPPLRQQQAPVEDMLNFEDGPELKSGSGKINPPPTSNMSGFNTVDPVSVPLNRSELTQKKEQMISDKVQEALAFKLELDQKEAKERLDFDLAKEKFDKKLIAWATNNKEKRNIRTLLSTMHSVLWEGSRWKEIGLGDVLQPIQVKKQYRKAMIVVHPDHNSNASSEVKYVSKRIFEAINEAYDEFQKKETV